MTRVVISQPNYIPWFGWFLLADQADHLVLLDTVQMTTRDWRNRNRIMTKTGERWLTVPVVTANHRTTPICRTKIASEHRGFQVSHWSTISHAYGKYPYFSDVEKLLCEFYTPTSNLTYLTEFTVPIVKKILSEISPNLRISLASDLVSDQPENSWLTADPNLRLIEVCKRTGGSIYLSSTGAKEYIVESAFRSEAIRVVWIDSVGLDKSTQIYEAGLRFSIIHDIAKHGIAKLRVETSSISKVH